jgi:hypothetical protein
MTDAVGDTTEPHPEFLYRRRRSSTVDDGYPRF